ncbi:MarR family winged helix-turn-helix transcriptional regulator [Agromyces bauzanensis]
MELVPHKALGISLWEATQIVSRAFDRELAAHGGNRPTWFVFLNIDRGEHTTQRDLARAIGITDATLSHHLGNLEERGLIRRDRGTRDRRSQRISFTDEGRAVFEEMRSAAITFDREMRATLGPERTAELEAALATLSTRFDTGEPLPQHVE